MSILQDLFVEADSLEISEPAVFAACNRAQAYIDEINSQSYPEGQSVWAYLVDGIHRSQVENDLHPDQPHLRVRLVEEDESLPFRQDVVFYIDR